MNAFLAAYDPINNLSIISLKDRKTVMDFLGVTVPFDWTTATIGTRIAQTNTLIRESCKKLGLDGSARTQSQFWYSEPVQELWKKEHTVKRPGKTVSVTVPEGPEDKEGDNEEIRESLKIQALLAEIGSAMGFNIWLPKSDRARVLKKWKPENNVLLDALPLAYDKATLKTIAQIDVLWVKKQAIARAFEVEHTTAVYSGLLRMADLLALQPNMNIKLHIVAPGSKREKVFQEIRRPVFSLLEGKALSEICSYLSYESITELRGHKNLEYLSNDVLGEYEETAYEND